MDNQEFERQQLDVVQAELQKRLGFKMHIEKTDFRRRTRRS